MKITRMKTNRVVNPLGFDLKTPTVSWTVTDTDAKKQVWARVEVSKCPEFCELIFDTGEDEKASSLGVPVKIELEPRTRYYWRVTVCADTGETVTSENAWFETAKMDEPFAGIRIAPQLPLETAPYMRKAFHIDGEVLSARAYFTGLGIYELYINGQKANDEYLTPNYNAYSLWMQYQTYDVTALLHSGDNAIGAILGNGWAKGRFGFDGGRASFETGEIGAPANNFTEEYMLYGELRVQTDKGETVIVTDESWQCAPNPITFGNIYDGERYEAAMEIENWACADCAYTDWKPVKPYTKELGVLTERLSLPTVVKHVLEPKVITTQKNELVIDVGQVMTGWLVFEADLPAGTQLRVQFGELLQDDCFYRDNMRSALCEYRFISDGRKMFLRPISTFYGFRYAKFSGIENFDCISNMKAWVLYSDLEQTGEIVTANEKVNRLYWNSVWGQRGNFLDVPTDCPQRDERMGWTGDAQAFCPTANYNMDCLAFYTKYSRDMYEEQKVSNGRTPDVAPLMVNRDEANKNIMLSGGHVGWGDAAAIVPWETYLASGDKAMLENGYDSMKLWADWIYRYDEAHGSTRLWLGLEFHFADWLALDGALSGFDPEYCLGGTDVTFLCSAYYYKSTTLVAKAALALGKTEDYEIYSKRAEEILKAIHHEFYTPGGRCAAATQTGNAISLSFGLAPESARQHIAADLHELLLKTNMHLKTGFLGTPVLCRALSDNGLNTDAYALFLQEDYPSWLYEVNMGATTVWERWNSVNPDGKISGTSMNSMTHYAYGAVFEWVYKNVCGLNPVEDCPGYKRAVLKPQPDQRLGAAKAMVNTAAGYYESGWAYDGDDVTYTFVVPFDAQAEVILTDKNGETVRKTLTAGTYTFTL
ncbi:MAG: family 78 glycoside hydrolase catalytic domain [Clostridia bacterium]|nr:family 78 glycoside hydrolase catalytic domain [Clostridia bacterium]